MTFEASAVLPLFSGFAESEWTLEEVPSTFVPQFGYGLSQIVRYNNARWRSRIVYENLSQDDRHLLARFVAHVGRHRSFWVIDPSLNLRGAFPSSELITAPHSTATWTGGTGRTVIDALAGIMSRYTGTQASYIYTSVSVTSGLVYAIRAVAESVGSGTLKAGLSAGSTAGASGYGSLAASTTFGRKVLKGLPTGATMYVNLTDDIVPNANWSTVYPQTIWREASVVRALTVDGGSGAQTQTGSRMFVDNGASSNYGLRAGDMIEVVSAGFSQMLRVTQNVFMDASGFGIIHFEPQLRGAVSDGDLVIPLKPMCRMRLSEDPSISTRPGWYSTVELNCEEAFE